MDTTTLHRMALASLRGINAATAAELTARFDGNEQMLMEADEREFTRRLGSKSAIASESVRRAAVEAARREMEFVEQTGISVLHYSDPRYPRRLAECPDAPVVLYTFGDCDLNATAVLAIVGTRHATSYGVDAVRHIVDDLAAKMPSKPLIVSGLAFGIDIAAHRAAMSASVPTAAVLAHGLNTIYPAAHRNDAVEMARSGGMLVTEYRSADATHRGNFLARNRIIAGLADCVLVAESAAKGGAIVTARLARDYDREVAALPGRTTDPYSAGCNRLIARNVAGLVTDADDLAALMGWHLRSDNPVQAELALVLSPEEQAVIDLLTSRGDLRQPELAVALDLTTSRLINLLVDMEFRGLIAQMPGGRYRLA